MLKSLLVAGLAAVAVVPSAALAVPPMGFDKFYEKNCGNVLNLLPHIVRKEAVQAIPDDASVSIHRVCTGVYLNDFGNAVGLGKTIAANHALAAALARAGFIADNVVGIQIDGDVVQLYVHRP